MAHIPKNAQWYIAEVVQEIKVEDSGDLVAHSVLTLIQASSPEDAYEKSLKWGGQSEIVYDNPAGKQVIIRFVGLGDLCVIYDPLEDGAELLYSERVVASQEDVERLVRPKENLSVFADDRKTADHPDYRSGEVIDKLANEPAG